MAEPYNPYDTFAIIGRPPKPTRPIPGYYPAQYDPYYPDYILSVPTKQQMNGILFGMASALGLNPDLVAEANAYLKAFPELRTKYRRYLPDPRYATEEAQYDIYKTFGGEDARRGARQFGQVMGRQMDKPNIFEDIVSEGRNLELKKSVKVRDPFNHPPPKPAPTQTLSGQNQNSTTTPPYTPGAIPQVPWPWINVLGEGGFLIPNK